MNNQAVLWPPGAVKNTRSRRILAWSLCGATLLILALSVLLDYLDRSADLPAGWPAWPATAVFSIGLAGAPVLGAFVASCRPHNLYGWAWLGFGMGSAVSGFGGSYATYAALSNPGVLPAPRTVATILGEGWAMSVTLLPFLLMLFPDGRLPSRRWRMLA